MTNTYCQILNESIGQPKIMNNFNIKNSAEDFSVSTIEADEVVFQNLWERYNLPVRKFIFDMCGSFEQSEELAQETFVRVFKGLNNFRQETKISTWIFGIAKNVVLESFREKKKQSRNVEIETVEDFATNGESASPENSLIEAEMFGAVFRALEKIEPEQKISFVLRVFHHKSYQEIAEITGFGISKIKIDIFRIRTKLRKQLSFYLKTNDEL